MGLVKYVNETEGFKLWSTKAHGTITLPLAVIGVIFNVLTIAIFSQKSMRSLTNNILLGISVFDILLMVAYIPYTIYFYLLGSPDPVPGQYAFWPYYALLNSHLSLFAHGCSVWFTCFLALYRYLTVTSCVTRGSYNPKFNESRVRNTMIVIVLVVFSFMIFNVLSYGLQKQCFIFTYTGDDLNATTIGNYETCEADESSAVNETNLTVSASHSSNVTSKLVSLKLLWIGDGELSRKHPSIPNINFWVHAIFFRTVPCMLLLVLSMMLIYVMRIANLNRLKLMQQGRRSEYEKAGEFNRTTTMLLIVVISFLMMELPHGVLYIICSISTAFFSAVYVHLGDLLDLLVLINSSINFFLYCCMSSQFRDKFKQMFCSMFINSNQLNKQSKIVATSNINLKRLSRVDNSAASSAVLANRNSSLPSPTHNITNTTKSSNYLYVLFNHKKNSKRKKFNHEPENLTTPRLSVSGYSNNTNGGYKENSSAAGDAERSPMIEKKNGPV